LKATGLKNFETRIIGKLCETVSKIIQEILGDKISLLKAALIAIILAVGKFPDHKNVLLNLSPQDLSIARYVINDPNQTIGPELIAQANFFYDDIVAELVEKAIDRLNQCETLIIRGSIVTK
jgi:flagellar biosynthesis/type III secretory pathway protein FliH